MGTAVSVVALDAAGRFIGGLIILGFGGMQRALKIGTAGLRVPNGEVVDFPNNTSDAPMSGGANAIAGAIERQARRLQACAGVAPLLSMTVGRRCLAPVTDLPFETDEALIFEGLLLMRGKRLAL